jgi:hypothetical protein
MNQKASSIVVLFAVLAVAPPARAQVRPAWGRVAFFGNGASTSRDGAPDSSFSELIGQVTFESATGDEVNYEYRADLRFASYPGADARPRRISIYDAYAGVRVMGGRLGVRGGQMWISDLGGLGALGGAMVEFRQGKRDAGGRWRAALFGGLEPQIMDVGYVDQVYKVGGLVSYEGAGMRRHVLGFVNISDHGVTERSVFSFTNFLPVARKVYIYQAGEWDVSGPGVSGAGNLTYFFINGRYVVNSRLEIQGLYHHGHSIDSRSIVRDQLDGRPVDPKALDGMKFESLTARATVTLFKNVRIYGGVGQDRNNRDDQPSGRFTFGLFAPNVFKTGIDLTVSDSRMDRGASGSYDAWYASVGRSFGGRVYVTGDYSSSISIYRFTSATGFVLDTRPRTQRFAASGIINFPHGASFQITAERVLDSDATQTRLLSGISYRF